MMHIETGRSDVQFGTLKTNWVLYCKHLASTLKYNQGHKIQNFEKSFINHVSVVLICQD